MVLMSNISKIFDMLKSYEQHLRLVSQNGIKW